MEKADPDDRLIKDVPAGNGVVSASGTHFILSGPENGDLVCCIHGIGSYNFTFDYLATDLVQAGHRVLRYDLIGRGYSQPSPNGRYGAEEHIQQFQELFEELGISGRITLIGHSMGGALAIILAHSLPDKVKAIFLVSPAGLMSSGALPIVKCCTCLHGLLKAELSKPAYQEEVWRKDFFEHKGEKLDIENETIFRLKAINQVNPEHFNAFWMSVLQFPLYGLQSVVKELSKRNVFIAVVWGDKDAVVPIQPSLSQFQKLLTSAISKESTSEEKKCRFSYRVIKNSGHGLLLEHREETNLAIMEIFQEYKDIDKALENTSTDNKVVV